jgi:CopG family nickel-responsive transcriptional regulator
MYKKTRKSNTKVTQKIERTGVSLPRELLRTFDEIIYRNGYTSRSEAIRDTIRDYISRKRLEEIGERIGVISVVYNHEVSDKHTKLQHGFKHKIVSSLHVHIDEDNCLEIIVTKGKAVDIHKFSNMLQSKKGTKLVRTVFVPNKFE